MKEKTLRYPGHVEYIKVLKESGFLNTDKVDVDGTSISPLEFTSKILFDEWKLDEAEEEFTVMRITLKGKNTQGCTQKVVYELYDEHDSVTQTSSMARTTGYTATATASMFFAGLFEKKGVFPPELVGKHEECFDYIINYLKVRGIIFNQTTCS